MSSQLQKAINLSKKTGDRLIVFDRAESESPYVVMSLDDYEKLAIGQNAVRGLTEAELLDKINRDVAIWKNENKFNDFGEQIGDFHSIDDIEKYNINEINEYYDEPEDVNGARGEDFSFPNREKTESEPPKKKRGFGHNWSIPSDRKRAAEEVDEKEEDRQYLEEIPF